MNNFKINVILSKNNILSANIIPALAGQGDFEKRIYMCASYNRRNTKIVRYRKTHFNIGTILFVMLLVYIIVVSVTYLQKEPLSIYEVTEKNRSDDNSITGIALREETVYNADTGGTIALYNSKSKKVAKGSPLFSIDSTGAFSNYISDLTNDANLSKSDIDYMRNAIHNYRIGYDNADYTAVQDFKYTVESSILSAMSQESIDAFLQQINQAGSKCTIGTAVESGIVTYWSDGLENLKKEDITPETFEQKNYSKISVKTSDTVDSGQAVCKVATSEKWSIVVKLDSEQYAKLEKMNYVKIRFCSDNLEINANYDLYTSGTDYYASINFNGYLARYIDERFIKIELILNSVEGLKIPKSSLIEKNCYKVPIEFLTKGQQSTKDILVYIPYENSESESDGTPALAEIDSFCMKDENFVYIDANAIKPGTVFIKPGETADTFVSGEMQLLKGVYNVNKGYCQFKYVDILYENQEYCIISKDTPYGLSLYDHILINPELINENDIIY